MIPLVFALACTTLSIICAVACLIDGHHRERATDPTIELEEIAHRWATQPTRTTKEQP